MSSSHNIFFWFLIQFSPILLLNGVRPYTLITTGACEMVQLLRNHHFMHLKEKNERNSKLSARIIFSHAHTKRTHSLPVEHIFDCVLSLSAIDIVRLFNTIISNNHLFFSSDKKLLSTKYTFSSLYSIVSQLPLSPSLMHQLIKCGRPLHFVEAIKSSDRFAIFLVNGFFSSSDIR